MGSQFLSTDVDLILALYVSFLRFMVDNQNIIELHEPHRKPEMNSGVPEEWTFLASLYLITVYQ